MLFRFRFPIVLVVVLGAASAPRAAEAQAGGGASGRRSWSAYEQRTLRSIIEAHAWLVAKQVATGDSDIAISGDPLPTRAALSFSGERRPLSPAKRALIDAILGATGRDSTAGGGYAYEYRFREDSAEYWIPLQEETRAWVDANVKRGDAVTVFTIFLGDVTAHGRTEWLFVATGV
jgi:hypothetical protein